MLKGASALLGHVVPAVLAWALPEVPVQAAPPSICAPSAAQRVDPQLPAYRPQPVEMPRNAGYVMPDGAINVVGYNDMREMLQAMNFSAAHPHVRFRLDLPGTRFAPAALANGLSAFAPMGACSPRRSSRNTEASRAASRSPFASPTLRWIRVR